MKNLAILLDSEEDDLTHLTVDVQSNSFVKITNAPTATIKKFSISMFRCNPFFLINTSNYNYW